MQIAIDGSEGYCSSLEYAKMVTRIFPRCAEPDNAQYANLCLIQKRAVSEATCAQRNLLASTATA